MTTTLLAILVLIPPAFAYADSAATAESSETWGPRRVAFFEEHVVWRNKEEGAWPHHVYGLVRTRTGALLAFTEARVKPQDQEPHHLVAKRSTDGGRTWSPNTYIERADGSFWSANGQPGRLEAWTNPGPVADEKTGRVFLFYALNEGSTDQKYTRVFYRYSDDDGHTWLPAPRDGGRIEVTPLFSDNLHGWTFHMPGPGHGIQLRHQRGINADGNGRLVIPVWHRRAVTTFPRRYGVSMLVSDDHGRTWRRAGDTGVSHGMAEGRIVELEDGRILLNARGGAAIRDGTPFSTEKHRVEAWSEDGGETFGAPVVRAEFEYSGNGCDSSIQRYAATAEHGKSILLFSRPADPGRRARMTVSLSTDEGRTWSRHKLIHEGPSFYSDLIVLPDGIVGLLYGKGKTLPCAFPEHVAFARFNLEWLLQASEPDEGPAKRGPGAGSTSSPAPDQP